MTLARTNANKNVININMLGVVDDFRTLDWARITPRPALVLQKSQYLLAS